MMHHARRNSENKRWQKNHQLEQWQIWETKPFRGAFPSALYMATASMSGWVLKPAARVGEGSARASELALLIQLMKGLSSESSCPPLSASKFPACLISPLNVSREKARGQNRGG